MIIVYNTTFVWNREIVPAYKSNFSCRLQHQKSFCRSFLYFNFYQWIYPLNALCHPYFKFSSIIDCDRASSQPPIHAIFYLSLNNISNVLNDLYIYQADGLALYSFILTNTIINRQFLHGINNWCQFFIQFQRLMSYKFINPINIHIYHI